MRILLSQRGDGDRVEGSGWARLTNNMPWRYALAHHKLRKSSAILFAVECAPRRIVFRNCVMPCLRTYSRNSRLSGHLSGVPKTRNPILPKIPANDAFAHRLDRMTYFLRVSGTSLLTNTIPIPFVIILYTWTRSCTRYTPCVCCPCDTYWRLSLQPDTEFQLEFRLQ